MSSFIWNRDIDEAYNNPYEYDAQQQFSREAESVLRKITKILVTDDFIYGLDEVSLEKSLYMLHVDTIESLFECLKLLNEKRHSIAGRLMRDVFENISLCNYFYFDCSPEKDKNLKLWFKNEVIKNSICRKSIKERNGEEARASWAKTYKQLSKLTHRTYRSLAYSYIRGKENTIRYEGRAENKFLVPPSTISMYYALLSQMILLELNEISANKIISPSEIENIYQTSLEERTCKRKFSNIISY